MSQKEEEKSTNLYEDIRIDLNLLNQMDFNYQYGALPKPVVTKNDPAAQFRLDVSSPDGRGKKSPIEEKLEKSHIIQASNQQQQMLQKDLNSKLE